MNKKYRFKNTFLQNGGTNSDIPLLEENFYIRLSQIPNDLTTDINMYNLKSGVATINIPVSDPAEAADIMEELIGRTIKNNDSEYRDFDSNDVDIIIETLNSKKINKQKTLTDKTGKYSLVLDDETRRYVFCCGNDNNEKLAFSGVGVMIFEQSDEYHDQTVLLFQSSRDDLYEELAGGFEIDDFDSENTLQNTLKREIIEESANIFNFNDVNFDSYPFRQVYKNNYLYRCYAVFLDSESYGDDILKTYHKNKEIMRDNKTGLFKSLPPQWNETKDIKRFYLNDISKLYGSTNTELVSTDGDVCNISQRTKKTLLSMLTQNILDIASNDRLEIKSVQNITSDFLNNTTTYVVS